MTHGSFPEFFRPVSCLFWSIASGATGIVIVGTQFLLKGLTFLFKSVKTSKLSCHVTASATFLNKDLTNHKN